MARHSRDAKKTADAGKVKKVLDNEDLQKYEGPIPDVAILQPENSEEIVNAIIEYSKTHDDHETESVIHDWYDQEMALARAEMSHNVTIYQDRASVTSANSLDRPNWENPYSYWQQQAATQQRDLSDIRTVGDNQETISKIMSTLRKVKSNLLFQKRYDFAWFDTDYPRVYTIQMTNRPQLQPSYR